MKDSLSRLWIVRIDERRGITYVKTMNRAEEPFVRIASISVGFMLKNGKSYL